MEEEKIDETVQGLEKDAHFMDAMSRQIGVYGLKVMGKLKQMKVLIVGLRGVGLETAKNLILAGPHTVTVCDNNLVTWGDLATNFFARESDVGKTTRSACALPQLKELNPYVNVNAEQADPNSWTIMSNYNVVVVTESYDQKVLTAMNEFCHNNGIGFIHAGVLGLYAHCFLDFGDDHKITDKDGQAVKLSLVAHIDNREENPEITCNDKHPHDLSQGQFFKLEEVGGMTELNGAGPFKVTKVNTPFNFCFEANTKDMPDFTDGGFITQVKVPFKVKYKKYETALQQPYCYELINGKPIRMMMHNPDMMKWERAEQLHVIHRAILQFAGSHGGQLPRLNSEKDATQVAEIAKAMIQAQKDSKMEVEDVIKLEEADAKLAMNVARFARAQISPIASFMGGIIAQEVIKFTGKFTPLCQWLHVEWFDCLPEGDVDRTVTNDRYSDFVAIFGNEVATKMRSSKYFLVGCGALGCEYIKMLSMMGVGCSKEGLISTTDDDCIELSNLNRQFLFRQKDVKQSKSKCAARIGREMNPDLNIRDYNIRVSPDTEKIFNDEFWQSQDGVLNALDNVKARRYVDSKVVFYQKSLLEAGTLGTLCNSQVVMPFETQSYGDSPDQPEKGIPLCTLKNFPYLLDHCIQWARDYFELIFVKAPYGCSQFVAKGKGYIDTIKREANNNYELAQNLSKIVQVMKTLQSASQKSCVLMARECFEFVHYNQVANLVFSYPKDFEADGVKFWTAPKRFPQLVNYDSSDEQIMNWVFSASNIFAFIYGQKEMTMDECKKISDSLNIPKYTPQKIVVKENANDDTEDVGANDEKTIEDCLAYLNSVKISPDMKIKVVDFEKDDDSNHHIDFLTAVANLRGRNYHITEGSRHKVKMIAGKIIPAIATSTALIVGMNGMELIKSIVGKKVDVMRNSYVNLALPLFVFSEPMPPKYTEDCENDPIMMGPVKAIPGKFSCWDKEHLNGPLTIQQLVDHYKTKYNVELSQITMGPSSLYSSWGNNEGKMGMELIAMYEKIQQGDKVFPPWASCAELVICGETEDGIDCLMPNIVYHIKK